MDLLDVISYLLSNVCSLDSFSYMAVHLKLERFPSLALLGQCSVKLSP